MLSMNISKLSTDWNISAIVSSNAKARGGTEEEMQKEFEEAMMNTIHHEMILKSKGRASKFMRTTEFSELISQNFMMSRSLQIVNDKCKKWAAHQLYQAQQSLLINKLQFWLLLS